MDFVPIFDCDRLAFTCGMLPHEVTLIVSGVFKKYSTSHSREKA